MLTPGDIYEVASTQTYSGSVLLNVFHVQLLVIPTGPQAKFQALADDIKEFQRGIQTPTLAYTTWKATQVAGADVVYDAVTCRRTGGDVYEGNHTGTLNGSAPGSAGNASFQACVSALKTGLAGRSRRGAVYTGGTDANYLDTADRDYFTTGMITAFTTLQQAFFNKYKGTGGTDPTFKWVVFSKFIASGCKYVPASPKWIYTHVQPGNAATAAADVTSVTPRRLVVPMRRRKEGRGI